MTKKNIDFSTYLQEKLPLKKELCEIGEEAIWKSRFTCFFFCIPKDCLRVVSRHIVETIHWWSLERAGPDPLQSWAPETLARHVLLALDELVTALRCQNLRCYFHPRCNVMLQCAKGSYVSSFISASSYSILHL